MKNEKSAVKISLPLTHNAYGAMGKNYELSDTISHDGEYIYKIYGVSYSEMLLLGKEKINFPPKGGYAKLSKSTRSRSYKEQIDYFLKRKGTVKIEIMDGVSQKRLFSTYRRSTQGKNTIMLDLEPFVSQGITFFNIIIRNKDFQEEFPVRFSK